MPVAKGALQGWYYLLILGCGGFESTYPPIFDPWESMHVKKLPYGIAIWEI
jgi:hypothetical protein